MTALEAMNEVYEAEKTKALTKIEEARLKQVEEDNEQAAALKLVYGVLKQFKGVQGLSLTHKHDAEGTLFRLMTVEGKVAAKVHVKKSGYILYEGHCGGWHPCGKDFERPFCIELAKNLVYLQIKSKQ